MHDSISPTTQGITMTITFEALNDTITELSKAERITKKLLGSLSRDLLQYVIDTDDVRPINRLLGTEEHDGKPVLTYMNRQTANLYFKEFLPWSNEETKQGLLFKNKNKDERFNKKLALIVEWLADELNDIWLWAKDNIDIGTKKDYAAEIQKAIKAALKGNDKLGYEPLSIPQVLDAVMSAEGIDIASIITALGK